MTLFSIITPEYLLVLENSEPTGKPLIEGIAAQGEFLTAGAEYIVDDDGLGEFSYQWQRDGNPIASATESTYQLSQSDVGSTITVMASYTDGGGVTESLVSNPTQAVANKNDIPTGTVVIDGIAFQGETLTCDITGLNDEDGLGAFSYQWLSDGYAISGETGTELFLTQDHVGKVITVRVDYVDGFGEAESVSSDATPVVVDPTVVADITPPTIAITTSDESLTAGETSAITFTLSEESSDFTQADVTVSGGTLSGFTGSGTTYTATFTPTTDSTTNGVVSVASGTFTDASGNANEDGSDANNTVTMAVNTVQAVDDLAIDIGQYSLTVIANVFGSIMFLDDLTETVTSDSHTIEYNGTTFDYDEVDAIITTVVRDDQFTEEFSAEIAESFPEFEGISYSTALALIGQPNMEGTLLMVAGFDGNYVG